MAGESEWGQALRRVLDANAAAGRKPATWHGLYRALTDATPGGPKLESWKRDVARYRKGGPVSADKAAALAVALGVKRDALPEEKPTLSLEFLARRLAAVEGELAEVKSAQKIGAERLARDILAVGRRVRRLEGLAGLGRSGGGSA